MNEPAILPARRWAAAALAGALMLTGLGAAGCGLVNKVNKITNTVQGNEAIIDTFTGRMSATSSLAYQATYVTAGGSTVVSAVRPPQHLTFSYAPAGSSGLNGLGRTDIIVNPSGEYPCTLVPAPGSGWACQKLSNRAAARANKVFAFYTPSHWVTFLQDFSIAAGFAGDKITKSTMTVNGFHLDCIDFRASGVPGTSTLCVTSQGILGYVKVATAPTSFTIKAYSPSPPASLFQLPKGAKVRAAKGRG